nr:von Willebrand factor type A domain-containing protein [Gammaproteobacteria bacterium]
AVRIEELINYFDYDYPTPKSGDQPFSLITEVSRAPWNPDSHLVHVGIKGVETAKDQRPAANLVFLIDVSGSMNSQDKLPLLKNAFKLLVKQLNEHDRVSLVVYAGASGVVLEPTKGSEQGKIFAALERLTAGGSTHGSAGIQLAYAMAEQDKIADGINRVILATDGDFNVGTVNHEQLIDLIEQQRQQGISLTTLGFGQGNYNDHLMEQLADKGNGNYAYIDTTNEAQKVLVEELAATLETIAKDVKIQIEWNPAVVAEYRLIGYENRVLAREDFNNDKVDAGDIGAGHSVTALYEVTLVTSKGQRLDPLRYGQNLSPAVGKRDEIALLRLRYKAPEGETSKLIERVVKASAIEDDLAGTSDNFRFSAAVAGFGQLLRGGRYTENFDYAAVAELARGSRGKDNFGYRGEFLRLVQLASSVGS